MDDQLEELKKVLPNASPEELQSFAKTISNNSAPVEPKFIPEENVSRETPGLAPSHEPMSLPSGPAQQGSPREQMMREYTPEVIQSLRADANPNKGFDFGTDVLPFFPRLAGAAHMFQAKNAAKQAYAQGQLDKLGQMTQQDREYARQMAELGNKTSKEQREQAEFAYKHPKEWDDPSTPDSKISQQAAIEMFPQNKDDIMQLPKARIDSLISGRSAPLQDIYNQKQDNYRKQLGITEARVNKENAAGDKVDKDAATLADSVNKAMTEGGNSSLKKISDDNRTIDHTIGMATNPDGSIKNMNKQQALLFGDGAVRAVSGARPAAQIAMGLDPATAQGQLNTIWGKITNNPVGEDAQKQYQFLVDGLKTMRQINESAYKDELFGTAGRLNRIRDSHPDLYNNAFMGTGYKPEDYDKWLNEKTAKQHPQQAGAPNAGTGPSPTNTPQGPTKEQIQAEMKRRGLIK